MTVTYGEFSTGKSGSSGKIITHLNLVDSGVLISTKIRPTTTSLRPMPIHSNFQNVSGSQPISGGMVYTQPIPTLRSPDRWTAASLGSTKVFCMTKPAMTALNSYHDGFLSQMDDGTLVVFAFRADRSQPDQPMFSASGGLITNEPVLFLSEDGGHQ